MPESYQDRLKRVRPPRVQIDYKVETEGAEPILELPFVVGVMADLSAMGGPTNPDGTKRAYKQRRFIPIDRDNFNSVMAQQAPRLAMKVPNKLTGNGEDKLAVELNFKSMDDFQPAKIAAQVPVLNELLEMRQKLTQLLSKMEGNDALEQLLADVIKNTDKAQALAAELSKETGEAK